MSELLASILVAENGAGGLTGLLPFVLMIGVIYFIVLRPMGRQEKDRKKRVEALKKGDQVVLGGGILGRISNADDEKIAVVEIADRVKVRVLKKDIVDTQAAALEDKSKAAAKDKDAAKDAAKDKEAAKDKDKDKAKADEKKTDDKGVEAAS
jgi:preprotein translocase subunit YajC